MVIVDTSVWIDYLRDHRSTQVNWLHHEMGAQRLGLTDLMLCEILQGVPTERAAATVKQHLFRFEIFETGGVPLAIEAALNYRLLRARGVTIRKTIDCLIATFCLMKDHSLLHDDRDFDPFEHMLGLRVLHP